MAQRLDLAGGPAGPGDSRLIAGLSVSPHISTPSQRSIATENVEIIGGHSVAAGRLRLARSNGVDDRALELTTDWAGALVTAKEIHDCLAVANFNAYIWWYAKRYYGPLGEDGVVTKRGHVMTQFTKFIRPGYVRVVATASPASQVYVSVYKREKFVIVSINQSVVAVDQASSSSNCTRALTSASVGTS
jgi:glucuronoarabinoxylan endo-1,4-beta-xylanase